MRDRENPHEPLGPDPGGFVFRVDVEARGDPRIASAPSHAGGDLTMPPAGTRRGGRRRSFRLTRNAAAGSIRIVTQRSDGGTVECGEGRGRGGGGAAGWARAYLAAVHRREYRDLQASPPVPTGPAQIFFPNFFPDPGPLVGQR